jgi:hypothetical protein
MTNRKELIKLNPWRRLLFTACICVFLGSCGKSDTPEPEPDKPVVVNPDPDPKPPTPPSTYFISFKYNGKDYKIADDENCIFTRRADNYHTVSGSTASTKQAFTLNIGVTIEQGGSYDIYASSIYVASSIRLLFTVGDELAEESFFTDEMSQVGVIGKLTITELTDKRMSGTFACRTTNGEITDGKFTVKAKVY